MMEHAEWLEKQAQLTMARLLPRCQSLLKKAKDADIFHGRMEQEFPRLFGLLYNLYGNHYDFFYHIEQILLTAAQMFVSRPSALRALDREREANPLWFQSEKMVGGVCYVDLFAGNLTNMHEKIPYFKELGLTYLHLMPLFAVPERNNDGGYAISDYRAVNPKVGTMEQLADFATALREEGISLVLDFVFNHTSDEHEWAQRAVAGDETYQGYYFMFPDRTMPDAYERTLREIFPEQAPGSFTYNQQAKKWVWTSFWNFQWDLNYQNPAVFNAMLGEMLFLANQGIQVLRLDAVAFIWKQMGTACENLPQAHMIIQAYNALLKIVAPAMIFKSEAIVHPDDVASYISWNEAPLSYNPTLMALLWEALATRNVNLLQLSMAKRFSLPREAAWVNYVRVHDDIGWTFADEDAAELWINGFDHRQFLNQFYSGEFEGSFAKGVPFGVNPRTNDMRIAGTGASLAGLEQAIERDDEHLIEMGLRRWLLLHSIILSAGGIPLIYLGDEIATLNDYSYVDDPQKKDDSRWVHRPFFKWDRAEKRQDASTIAGRMFQGVQRMITLRKQTAAMGSGISTFFPTQNPHVLGFIRSGQLLVLANFSEYPQTIARDVVAAYSPGFRSAYDLLAAQTIEIPPQIELQPYEFRWLLFEAYDEPTAK
jgi:amylosucrase